MTSAANATDGDSVDFQYNHYQEGSRKIIAIDQSLSGHFSQKNTNPIEVDSIHGSARVALSDRVKFAFNYLQDTWGGATPIASAPALLGSNQQLLATDGTTVVGASPWISTPNGSFFTQVDKDFNFYYPNFSTGNNIKNNRITHILATASPETRKQGDFKLSYDWDEASFSVGGGISIEDDYESRFGNISGRWDLDQKKTSLNLGLSYTNSDTNAILNHDTTSYIARDPYFNRLIQQNDANGASNIRGIRQDWAASFGITQIINKNALVEASAGYARSTGYLSNPYKLTEAIFINPDDFLFSDKIQINSVQAFLERRPEIRNQWNVGGRYVHYIAPIDAALHFSYQFSADDWGIQAHTFETDWVQPLGQGWSVTPRIRYYSQEAADFYQPFLKIKQPLETDNSPGSPSVIANKLPAHFSSDQRLSGFGALSGGVTVAKQFAKGVSLETGFEYYSHQGSLKIGGGGERIYADYDYWVANAALKVDLAALSQNSGNYPQNHALHNHHHHHGVHAPAGVMFDHMLPKAGDLMTGYRYMYASQGAPMLNGSANVNDAAIIANGCGGDTCFLTPNSMSMHMHMLDLMYAPTDWLTLMLMPQFMDMNMSMRSLDGAPSLGGIDPSGGLSGHATHHVQNGHETGGIGDLGMYALFKVFDQGNHHIHATAGLSAPIGDVDIHLQRNHQVDGGFIHYGMQLGSGTWDFKPSLTYTGHLDNWSWGAQASGTVRIEDRNKSGYRLGDIFQATAWGSYNLTSWLSASVRGVYTMQGSIQGRFTGSAKQFFKPDGITHSSILKFGPQDYPQNYGGRYWDIGFGLSAVVPTGDLAGNRVSVEWLQPVEDDVNGYQLKRDGALSATWSVAF